MIGIFDSGLGGLTVAKAIKQALPDASYIYLGDTARMPYGNKSPETVTRYAVQNTAWLLAHGAKIIVIACNTASSLAKKAVQDKYPSVPIFEVITPAAEAALAQSHNKNIGILATRATIASLAYQNILRGLGARRVEGVPAPLLVPLIEEGWLADPETQHILARYLSQFSSEIDTLILGCTHYPLITPLIETYFRNKIKIISSGAVVAQALKAYLEMNTKIVQSLNQSGQRRYFSTDAPPQLESLASEWMQEAIRFEKIILE